MIKDIPTFLEIVAQNHTFRPDGEKLSDEDVREIENLIEQLEKFTDRMVDGGAENYPQIALLSDRVKSFLLCMLFDEVGCLREE
jgi:hypothetical protein